MVIAYVAASFVFVVVALVVAFRGPLSPAATIGVALGMGIGGAAVGLLGAVVFFGVISTVSTEPGSHVIALGWAIYAAGVLVGMAGGAAFVAHLARQRRGLLRCAIASVVCGAVVCAAVWMARALSSPYTNEILPFFEPIVIFAASLAGFTRALPALRSA